MRVLHFLFFLIGNSINNSCQIFLAIWSTFQFLVKLHVSNISNFITYIYDFFLKILVKGSWNFCSLSYSIGNLKSTSFFLVIIHQYLLKFVLPVELILCYHYHIYLRVYDFLHLNVSQLLIPCLVSDCHLSRHLD